jgi:Tfp pilus assembly protein PilW
MALRRHRVRGCGAVELLLGVMLGLLVLSGLLGTLAAGSAALARAGRRAEASDTLQLAAEAVFFDVRRAGFDPRAIGVDPMPEAASNALTLLADLDGDGTIDAGSSERLRYRCEPPGGRLSRVVGAQSMPLASGLTTCRLDYLDDTGTPMVVPAAGLDDAGRARVRLIRLTVAAVPGGTGVPTTRRLSVALERPS